MKTMGLIGGMSWQSTLHYYSMINDEVHSRLGGLNSAEMLMYSVNFQRFEEPLNKKDWNNISFELTKIAKGLEVGGAEFIIICTNTMHVVAGQVQAGIRIPILHIVDPTAEAIKKEGIKKVGLIGTMATMEEGFYKGRLSKMHGIETVTPGPYERFFIHRVIFDELCEGKVMESSREALKRAIRNLKEQGAEGVILGCTELNMLIRKGDDVGIKVFDTTELHVKAAVNLALSDGKVKVA